MIFNSQGKLTQYASGNIDQTLSKFIDEKPMESYTNDSYGTVIHTETHPHTHTHRTVCASGWAGGARKEGGREGRAGKRCV